MAEVTAAAYQDIRDYVEANWSHIEVRSNSAAGTGGAPIVRLAVADPRVEIAESGGRIIYTVVLTGSDSDVPVPVTTRSSAIYKAASGGSAMSEEVHTEGDGAIAAEGDSVTITHTLEIPDIA